MSIVLGIVSFCLVGEGAYLVYKQASPSDTTKLGLLSIGFLFTALALLSKFKRFKGFGFEAEMWDQEQIRAHELVVRLEALSTPLIEQLALLAGTLGYKTADLPVTAKETLVVQLEAAADGMGHDPNRKAKELQPLVERVCRDYCWDVDWLVREKLQASHNRFKDQRETPQYDSAVKALTDVTTLKERIWGIDPTYMRSLAEIVQSSALDDSERQELVARINMQEPKFLNMASKLPSSLHA